MLKRGFSFAPGYRLEQFLGRGQFGQVWQASAPGGTAAAVKFIDLSGGEGEKEHDGIKRVKQIRHANLMPITAIWLLDVHGRPIEEAAEVELETLGHIPIADPMQTADSLPQAPPTSNSQSPSSQSPGNQETFQRAAGKTLSVTPGGSSESTEAAWLVVAMLLGGKSLQQRLRECVKNGLPGIPPKELLAYMDESAKGLDFLNMAQHDLGDGLVAIQHCDVKPANIVLIGSSAVVCDFGLARILTRNQVTATSASGTPAYMAPEAIAGKPSRTSDQYSLAVSYYHLRTGSLPINDGTLWEVLDAHRTGKLDLSRVPEHEQAVLRRATSLDWEKRFDSNLDFVESLREALRAEGHTRPVMLPSGINTAGVANDSSTSNANAPTSVLPNSATVDATKAAVDPSMTLLPGSGIPALSAVGDAVAAFETDDSSETDDSGEANEAPFSIDRKQWWFQPQWLAAGAIAIVAPMLLIVLLSGGTQSPVLEDDKPKKDNEQVVAHETAAELLAKAESEIDTEFQAALATFEKAASLDPSLRAISPSLLLTDHQGLIQSIDFEREASAMVSVGTETTPFQWPLGELTASRLGQSITQFKPPKHVVVAGTSDVISALAADPSGSFFAVADYANHLNVVSFAQPQELVKQLTLEDSSAVSIAWHPQSTYVVAATLEPASSMVVVPVGSVTDGAISDNGFHRIDMVQSIKSIAIDPRGRWLVVLDNDGLASQIEWTAIERALAVPAQPPIKPITSRGSRVTVISATVGNDDDSALVTGGEDGEVTLWSLGAEPALRNRQSIHAGQVTALAVSARGVLGPIASGDDLGTIGVWRADAAQAVVKLPVHRAAISSLDMSSDGRWLAAASLDGEVTLWDLSRDELPMVRLTSSAGPATVVRLDRSLRWLAVGHEQGLIELWDLRHARLLVEESDKRPTATPPKTLQPVEEEGKSPLT